MDKEKLSNYIKEESKIIKRVKIVDLKKEVNIIVFLDSAYTDDKIISCFLFFDFINKKVIKKKSLISEIEFPYIPTYLSLREGPNYIKGLKDEKYDLIIVDGQGIAHPRKVGIATYLGVKLNKPSIGVAKKILYGRYEPCEKIKGNYSKILDNENNLIGYTLITKDNVKPIFISPGNLISFKDTLNIIVSLIGNHRIPEPLREVHIYSKKIKSSLNENIYNR
ncbi:MAG: endonuclease V [Caldisericia bacterium]